MRFVAFLLLLVCAPAAWSQESAQPAASAEKEARPASESAITPVPSEEPGPRVAREPAPAEEARSLADGERQNRSQDFLYQILLTAVSALVTALIWKAVN